MKRSTTFWLSVLVALAMGAGLLSHTAPPADALTGVQKSCVAASKPHTAVCTLVVNGVRLGFTHVVTLANGTGSATYTAVSPSPAFPPPPGCIITVAAVTSNSFQFTAGQDPSPGAPFCPTFQETTIVLTESLDVGRTGTITQTVLDVFAGQSFTATATVCGRPRGQC